MMFLRRQRVVLVTVCLASSTLILLTLHQAYLARDRQCQQRRQIKVDVETLKTRKRDKSFSLNLSEEMLGETV